MYDSNSKAYLKYTYNPNTKCLNIICLNYYVYTLLNIYINFVHILCVTTELNIVVICLQIYWTLLVTDIQTFVDWQLI